MPVQVLNMPHADLAFVFYVQDEIIKLEKETFWLISTQFLILHNKEDQLNFGLAAIKAYWWNNPAGI